MKLKNITACVTRSVLGNYAVTLLFICYLFIYLIFSDIVLYAASANRKYVDNIIKVLADVVLRPRITEDEVHKNILKNIIYIDFIYLK